MFSLNTLFLFCLLLTATLFGKTVPDDLLGPTEEEKNCVTRIRNKCYKTIPTLKLAKHEEAMGEDYYAEEMYKGLCGQGDGNGCLALSQFYSKKGNQIEKLDSLSRACDLGVGENCLQPYLARINKEKKQFKYLAIKDIDPEKEIYGPAVPFYYTYGPRSIKELTYGPALLEEPKTETRTIATTTDAVAPPIPQVETVTPPSVAPVNAEGIFSKPKYFIVDDTEKPIRAIDTIKQSENSQVTPINQLNVVKKNKGLEGNDSFSNRIVDYYHCRMESVIFQDLTIDILDRGEIMTSAVLFVNSEVIHDSKNTFYLYWNQNFYQITLNPQESKPTYNSSRLKIVFPEGNSVYVYYTIHYGSEKYPGNMYAGITKTPFDAPFLEEKSIEIKKITEFDFISAIHRGVSYSIKKALKMEEEIKQLQGKIKTNTLKITNQSVQKQDAGIDFVLDTVKYLDALPSHIYEVLLLAKKKCKVSDLILEKIIEDGIAATKSK